MRQRRAAGRGSTAGSAPTATSATPCAACASTSWVPGFERTPLRSTKVVLLEPRPTWPPRGLVRDSTRTTSTRGSGGASEFGGVQSLSADADLDRDTPVEPAPSGLPSRGRVLEKCMWTQGVPSSAMSACIDGRCRVWRRPAVRPGAAVAIFLAGGLPHQDSNLGASTRSSGDIIAIRHGPGGVPGGEEGRGGRGSSPGRWRCRARAACRVRRRSRRPRPQ
jgi:hypothetical protein